MPFGNEDTSIFISFDWLRDLFTILEPIELKISTLMKLMKAFDDLTVIISEKGLGITSMTVAVSRKSSVFTIHHEHGHEEMQAFSLI